MYKIVSRYVKYDTFRIRTYLSTLNKAGRTTGG